MIRSFADPETERVWHEQGSRRLPAWSPNLGKRLVKASASAAASDFAALRTLREQLGQRFRGGVVLYLGDRMVPFGEQLWLAPLPVLWAP